MTRLLCLLLFPLACAVAQTVEGSVFDAATGVGVGGVKVELLKGATPFYETATDGGGRFRIDNVTEGDYAARYQSPAYWLTAGPSDYRLFHVSADNPVKLEVRLMPWSRVSGRVVDPSGDAVANARLELTGFGMVANGRTYLRTSWGGGGGGQLNAAPLEMTFMGNTGPDGRFEVQLMPGAYGLSLIPPPDLKPPDPEPGGPALAWQKTYYPGVAAPDAASKLVVLPAGELSGIELKLLAAPSHAVRGRVLNPDGAPAPKVPVTMGQGMRFLSAESKPDGTFEFPAVAEGEWRFLAESHQGPVKLRAAEWVEVTRHDVENVKLRLASPITLRGKVLTETPQGASPPKPGPLVLSFGSARAPAAAPAEDDPRLLGLVMAIPDAKGEFLFQDAYPGVYHLAPMFQPLPAPYYLDEVRIGEADLAAQEVEISSDAAISVIYKSGGGSVRGKAERCASGGVLLVPADPARRRAAFSKSAPCDAAGQYEIRAVRPGDYYTLAFAGNGPVLPLNEALLTQAVKVTVRAGEASSADLTAITKPVY
jgi:hypothetical protein